MDVPYHTMDDSEYMLLLMVGFVRSSFLHVLHVPVVMLCCDTQVKLLLRKVVRRPILETRKMSHWRRSRETDGGRGEKHKIFFMVVFQRERRLTDGRMEGHLLPFYYSPTIWEFFPQLTGKRGQGGWTWYVYKSPSSVGKWERGGRRDFVASRHSQTMWSLHNPTGHYEVRICRVS